MREIDLYEPMRSWLEDYLRDKYPDCEVIAIDAHSFRLDGILRGQNLRIPAEMNGIKIEVDVVGIVIKNGDYKLFFIEAKKGDLTIRDLGQLWIYCQLIDPEEAFLMTPANFGQLTNVCLTSDREDLLEYGRDGNVKKMTVVIWDVSRNAPDFLRAIPRRN